MVQMRMEKSFLLLFFKKEGLPSFSNQPQQSYLGSYQKTRSSLSQEERF
jgi:hypothetical protein